MLVASRAMTVSTISEATDEDLVEAARQGDREAFAVLAARYRDVVFAYAYARLRDRDEAEDAAQETFLRAFQNLHRLSLAERWAAWLMRILRNLCTDSYRRRGRQSEMLSEEWIDNSPTPEMTTLARERRRELANAVSSLPEKHQIVVLMHYGSGRSYRDIALALDLPETTVVGRMAAALRTLRRRLGKE
jgi:RNA polymerase sigma-70 factor (ECF subfamily)